MKLVPVEPRVTRIPNGSLYEAYNAKTYFGFTPTYLFRKDNTVVVRQIHTKTVGRDHRVVPYDILFKFNLDPFYVMLKADGSWKPAGMSYALNVLKDSQTCKDLLPDNDREIFQLVAPNLADYAKSVLTPSAFSDSYKHNFPYFLRPLWSGSLKKGLMKMVGSKGKMAHAALQLFLNNTEAPFRLMWCLRGLVAPETAFAFAMLFRHDIIRGTKEVRSLFIRLDRRLFSQKGVPSHFADTVRMYGELFKKKKLRAKYLGELSRFTNWRSLHEHLALAVTEVATKKQSKPYAHTEEQLEVGNITYERWELKLPKTEMEVVVWGSLMRHCIASYAKDHNKRCVLLGMYESGALKYNVMLNRDGSCVQFYGRRNETPSEHHHWILNRLLPTEAARRLTAPLRPKE